MSDMIAFCGLNCTKCPSYIATQNDDDSARAATAAMYAKNYGLDLKPEEINCDGCHNTNGRLLGYCQACEIRKCGSQKGLENCLVCDESPCDKLNEFHKFSPTAKEVFNTLLKNN